MSRILDDMLKSLLEPVETHENNKGVDEYGVADHCNKIYDDLVLLLVVDRKFQTSLSDLLIYGEQVEVNTAMDSALA